MLEGMLRMQAADAAGRARLKRMMARMLGGTGMNLAMAMLPAELKAALLEKRNVRVVERLIERSAEVRGNVAVFYGAAHMPGIEELLVRELGYRRAGARWLRAWDVSAP
jgi:uncharacterized protein YbaP (TraB family)